jgi:hypothetical protein
MNPSQFDIFLARLRFGKCNDVRPCLVLYPPQNDTITVMAISSQETLFDFRSHLWIEPTHPDFRATALKRRSYFCGNEVDRILNSELGAKLGRLEGTLLAEFKDWYGL